ncbi:MAG: hypothetical protein AAF745_06750, partial [Planctomycetota bacterium]
MALPVEPETSSTASRRLDEALARLDEVVGQRRRESEIRSEIESRQNASNHTRDENLRAANALARFDQSVSTDGSQQASIASLTPVASNPAQNPTAQSDSMST